MPTLANAPRRIGLVVPSSNTTTKTEVPGEAAITPRRKELRLVGEVLA